MSLINFFKRVFRKKKSVVFETISQVEEKKPSKPKTFVCAVCGKSVSGVERFVCRYCNLEHCEKHRLPEDHSCTSPKNPFSTSFQK